MYQLNLRNNLDCKEGKQKVLRKRKASKFSDFLLDLQFDELVPLNKLKLIGSVYYAYVCLKDYAHFLK